MNYAFSSPSALQARRVVSPGCVTRRAAISQSSEDTTMLCVSRGWIPKGIHQSSSIPTSRWPSEIEVVGLENRRYVLNDCLAQALVIFLYFTS